MSKFEEKIKEIAKIFDMEGHEDDVAYAILELIVKRRLDWRKICQQK